MDKQNAIEHTTNTINTEQSLYERDFYQWGLHNAELLRQGKFAAIDVENIAEELESMSKRDKAKLASRLSVLIMHLLKWQYQPKRRSRSWNLTITTQRAEIKRLLKNSPSLNYNIETVVKEEFIIAKRMFEDQTGISKKTLPEICPYSFEQLSDYDFLPE
ncbi:MAG: DUF29 domain-containing protein [Candidatus Magnetoovum sp. WYHC-5]|nr:DUF29 domain-containing protein [Candidatus Magnetoovum sp. WYHC-5]